MDMKKKKIIVISIILFLLIGIICACMIISGDKTKKISNNDIYTTIVLEINPKFAIEIDKNQNIINMYA